MLFCISCADTLTGDTGVEVLPPNELVEQVFIDTLTLELVTTVVDTAVPTCSVPLQVFGTLQDPLMGDLRATTYAQLLRPDSLWAIDRLEDIELDSVIVEIDLFDFNGDFQTPQELQIFPLSGEFQDCSVLNSKTKIALDTSLNLTANFRNPEQGLILDYSQDTTLPGTLIVPLDISLGQKLLSATAEDMSSDSAFQAFFHGLAFRTSLVTPNDPLHPGGMFRLDLATSNSTFLRLHYRQRPAAGAAFENKLSRFSIGVSQFNAVRPQNYFTIERSNEENTPLVTGNPDENEFIQAGSVVLIEGKIPSFKDLGILGVNQAEITFPVDSTVFKTDSAGSVVYGPLDGLEIIFLDDNGAIIQLEAILGFTVTRYNDELAEYSFPITPYLQEALDRNLENLNFIVRPVTQNNNLLTSFFNMSTRRVVLGGVEHPSLKPRLFMTVTR